MSDKSFLSWPFFTDRERALAAAVEEWCAANLPVDHDDVDAACRKLVAALGRDGWLMHTAPDPEAKTNWEAAAAPATAMATVARISLRERGVVTAVLRCIGSSRFVLVVLADHLIRTRRTVRCRI